ncbi:MAG: lycopene beta-cyclase CrtY [Sphingomicrobium sp.]
MRSSEPLIIVGGGLAGSLAALAIAARRPDVPLLLVEAGEAFGGNHTWSFFDGDVAGEGRALVDAMQPIRWPNHSVRFPGRNRTLGFGYNSVHSDKLDALVRERLAPSQYKTRTKVSALSPDGIVLADGSKIGASGVIDARGPDGPMPGLELAWQKFVGIEYDMSGHGLAAPIIMDTLVDQSDGYRFVYSLPFSPDRLLVEDTYYTQGPALDVPAIRQNIADYAAAQGWAGTPNREEVGLLPILLGGNPDAFWPSSDQIARLGLRGGFFHPTTGYSLPQATANAIALAEQRDLSGQAIAAWTRSRFIDQWRGGGFYRLLNRMLFRAARPAERVRIFNHFYRLDDQLVARFYAGRLTAFDKVRILSGKPPIPIFRALKAIIS